MVTILITILLGIIIGIINATLQPSFLRDLGFYIINSFIGAIFGLIIGIAIAFILPMDTYEKHYSINIVTLQDNNSTKGDFLLGCGNINGQMKYTFYYEENGLYAMKQLDHDLVKIKYSDGQPKVNVIEKKHPTNKWINAFALDLFLFDKTYVIEVPKGTIHTDYSLDAQ